MGEGDIPLREIPPSEDTAGQQLYTITLDRLTCNFFATASKLMKETHVNLFASQNNNKRTYMYLLPRTKTWDVHDPILSLSNLCVTVQWNFHLTNLSVTKFSLKRTIFVASVIIHYSI